MSYKKSDDRTNIVIVGGGSAGVNVARPLSKSLDPAKFNVILINPRPYIIFLIPMLRVAVSDRDNLKEQALVPYDRLFHNGNGQFIQGTVVHINQKREEKSGEVVLDNGETVRYDALVLATVGRAHSFPKDPSQVDPFINNRRQEFAKAKNILIVGGGSVGIELAGEIRDMWADKEITIIQRDKLLLNSTYPEKMRRGIQKQIESRNVKVILNDSLEGDIPEGPYSGTIQTQKGKALNPDLIVKTWGTKPDTEFIGASLGTDILSSQGLVKVNATLQLPAYPNIFAAGDIVDWPEQKQASKAANHAGIVAKNIISYATGKPVKKLYKGSTEFIMVTNGKESGLAYVDVLWGLMLGPWLNCDVQVKESRFAIPSSPSGIFLIPLSILFDSLLGLVLHFPVNI
ncbi:hypothetical protein VNI00_013521 [Paramarasmius palmivorus]|uniref:FAD/NAD(P)-binding domain-containing protein n=1 Tax=Paramarasmius palmivorus TaxID=297713 RepID=A0AAW0BYD5_9AGAR